MVLRVKDEAWEEDGGRRDGEEGDVDEAEKIEGWKEKVYEAWKDEDGEEES